MNISYNWLRALVPTLKDSPQEVAARLAMYGAPVDELVALGDPLRGIIIGRTAAVRRHPNSDHLSLCQVDAGGAELLSVVCGASNVEADRYYPFAPVGSTLPDGLVISQRKIRGELSQGMLCSARELNLGRDHEGILELQGTFKPGAPFAQSVGLDDHRIVVDVTPNRPDLLSHYGIARELAPRGESSIELPAFPGTATAPALSAQRVSNNGKLGGITISIDEAQACPRYLAAIVRGVRVGPSPEWLAARLRAVGQRPISNVVDATNYVLQELGQPVHAFDLDRLRGSAIVVRNARGGEELVTLDGTKRTLRSDMLVIADAERATALAGVMGGQDSEVGAQTMNLLIECAHFERKQIRATRRALGLSTDASYRFERGVDPTGMDRALLRVVELILACAGGQAEAEYLDVKPLPFEERELRLRLSRVEQVLGQRFTVRQVGALLEPIGFERTETERAALSVRVPGHRWFDVAEEIDLVEEVARRHGYNVFPVELRPARPSAVPDDPILQLQDRLRTRLVASGLLEARTAGFAAEPEGDVTLMLPLSSAESRLRRALLPGLLHRVEYNFTRGVRDVRLFELGSAFALQPGQDRPAESTRLALVLTGARAPLHWTGNPGDFQIWDLKGQADDLAHVLGLSLRPGLNVPVPGIDLIEASAAFELLHGDLVVGQAGRVRRQVVDAPAWAADLFALEVTISAEYLAPDVQYQALPVLPAIEQDLALLVPLSVNAAQVENILRGAGGDLLEMVVPFDLYQGAELPSNTRSIAFRLRFRAPDRTLTDADARTLVGRMLKRLKDEHGIERR